MNEGLRTGDPARLGGYELLGRLGEGGMGSVFLARSPQGRRVAVKVVRPDLSYDDEFRGRFRSEVNRARQVPPFCTAEVLDADPDHDPPYLVVEYVNGPSLAQVIREQGPQGAARTHSIAVGVATALTAIHGAGVIHRDLKPANVLMAPGGIKVIDFGIARAFEATSQHTRTNQVVGTVAYMAPERLDTSSGQSVGPAADIFAWGVLVAHAATGRNPFAGDSATGTAIRILTQPPDLTGLDGPLRELISRALEKDPAARPTARELLDGLLTAADRRAGTAASRADDGGSRTPSGTGGGQGGPGRVGASAKRRGVLVALGTIAAVIAVLVPAFLFGPKLLEGRTAAGQTGSPAAQDPVADASAPETGSTGSPSAPGTSSPTASPSSVDNSTGAILGGKRRIVLHVVELDRNLSMPYIDEVGVSRGTGKDALFALEPVGVDYMIKSLNPDTKGQPCLGVKIDVEGYASLVGTDCVPTAATLFGISRESKDDKGRTSYAIFSDTYGVVQWDDDYKKIYVEHLGDAPIDTTFVLVDRGAL